MAELKKARVAHGDLQGENLKVVTENGKPVVRFIDYDTMFVPGLDGKAVANVGHPAYQHPQRGRSTTLNHYDDHFGALVIYVSLLALAEDPGLWADVHTAGALDKELIFAKEDFAANSPSRLFHRLSKLSPTVRLLTIALWNFSRQSGIDRLPSLEDIVSQAEKQIAPPPPNPAAGATSNFDNLLKTLSSGATPSGGAVPSGAWFDDRDFRGAPPAAVAPPIPHTVRPGTPAWMINPSSRTAPTAPATSPTPGSFASMMAQAQSRVAHPVPVTPPGQITNASPPGAPVPVSPSNPTTLGEKIGAALVYCVVIYILLNILHACTH